MLKIWRLDFPDTSDVEIVERKWIWHPDTLTDALAEKISIEYWKMTREVSWAILHHNFDKLYIKWWLWRRDFWIWEMGVYNNLCK